MPAPTATTSRPPKVPATRLIDHTNIALADLYAVIEGRITTREYVDVICFHHNRELHVYFNIRKSKIAIKSEPQPIVIFTNDTLNPLTKSIQKTYELTAKP